MWDYNIFAIENYEKVFWANYGIANLLEEVKDDKQALFYFWRAFGATNKTKIAEHIAKVHVIYFVNMFHWYFMY